MSEGLKPSVDAWLYENETMVVKSAEQRPDLVAKGYVETPLTYHRAQPEAAPVEPVAWMYEYGGGTVDCTVTRYEPAVLNVLCYTETPLYTHPPAAPTDALVEKVARAIGQCIEGPAEDMDTNWYGKPLWASYENEARAALAAMQEAGK